MINNKQLCNLIINCNNYIWEKSLTGKKIESWLNNFSGKVINTEKEKEIARTLLSNFVYYNEKEIQYLCKNVHNLYKNIIVKEFISNGHLIHHAELLFNEHLKKCKISHIGRPSESGCFMLYYYRQINTLPVSYFLEDWDEINNNTKDIIFVDDFTGTGNTAIRFWKSSVIQEIIQKFKTVNLYYLTLVGLKKGIDNIKDNTNFNVICPQIFSDEYRVLSDTSSIFSGDEIERKLARKVCESYGRNIAAKGYALGFEDSEALIGFHHNIPNNTLPIIWSNNNGWNPIFHRHSKKYK